MVATVNASTSAGVVITPDNSGVLAFQSSSATALTIDASQNSTFVGTASATKLIPTGSSATGNGLYLPAANSLGFSTNGTNAVYIDSSQNVGIGATPNSKLYIRAATNANLRVTDSSGTLNLSAENDAGSAQVDMKFNGSQMMLESGGSLIVGGPYAVPPTTSFGRIVSSGIFQSGRTGTGSQPAAEFFNGNSNVGSIYTSGSNTSYNTSSDYRLKQDIAPITGALAKVALLKPSTYKWKVDGANGEGFIAHELAEVFPQAVTGEKDEVDEDDKPKYQAIDTSFLVATLTAAIQELKAINDTLTARIVALENR